MMLSILFVGLVAVSAVGAADNVTDDNVSVDNNDVNHVELTNDNSSFEENTVVKENLKEDDNDALSCVEEDDVLGASPPYNKYSVSVSDTTMNYGASKSITIRVSPVSGYDYKYDFYFRVYDSNGNKKIEENLYSTNSVTSLSYTISGTELSPGTYTIKLVNYADNHVMDTATLKVVSLPYSAYSVSVSDTTINYGSSGSIYMSISSASSSYNYKYDFYLKVYDSNGVEKISQRYYSTTAATSKTHNIKANALDLGVYTVKIINTNDNHEMSSARLTVKSVPYSAYSVRVSDVSLFYGSSGSILMSISPATDYPYKYDYYLKVYDTNNNEKISQRYYGTSSVNSKTYNLNARSLDPGVYTIMIINYQDNHVMSTASLHVNNINLETQDITGNCDGDIVYKVRASENGIYKMWYVDQDLTIKYTTSTDGLNWDEPTLIDFKYENDVKTWHLDVINSDLGYEMIVVAFDKWEHHNDMDLYYSKSSDGIKWDKATVILKPTRGTGFWDNRGIYRSSFVKINGTYLVYYGGTNESLHHGLGLVYGKDIHNLKSTNVNFSNKKESNKFAKKLESELK